MTTPNEVTRVDNNEFVTIATARMIVPYSDPSGDPTFRKNCKLCNSKHRIEAEALYEKSNNVSSVHRFLQNDRMEDMSLSAVRSHLINHVQKPGSALLETECAEDIAHWMNLQQDQDFALKKMIAILDREIMSIEALSDGLVLPERRRNAETIKKLMDTRLVYQSKLDEIKKEREPIVQIFQQIQIILKDTVDKNPIMRHAAVDIIDKIKQSCSGFLALGDKK